MLIKGTTQLLGVIGYPVEHSLSPLMHNAAIDQLGADYVYLPLPVHPERLADAIAGFGAIGLRGFNVTIPHKQAIIPFLDEVSEVAAAIGAVNTVWYEQGQWHGTNTDALGFLAPLKAHAKSWQAVCPVVLGNGGAARAVVAACGQLGCPQIRVVGRSPDKLETFAESWAQTPDIASKLAVLPWEQLPDLLPETDLLVNTTPVGMAPHSGLSPLYPAWFCRMPTGAIAYDLIYTPRPTQFLRAAQAAGLVTLDGLEMLVQQGAAALEIWLKQPAPVAVMRDSLLSYLESSAASSG